VSGRWAEKLDIVPLPDILQSIETISVAKKHAWLLLNLLLTDGG